MERKEVPGWPGYWLSDDGSLWHQPPPTRGLMRVAPELSGKYCLRSFGEKRRVWTVSPAALLAKVFGPPPQAPAAEPAPLPEPERPAEPRGRRGRGASGREVDDEGRQDG